MYKEGQEEEEEDESNEKTGEILFYGTTSTKSTDERG